MKISIVIPCKTKDDPQLKQLLDSIHYQLFPKEQVEILVMTEGNSEEAKAMGIKMATGQYILMLCSDNYLRNPWFLQRMCEALAKHPDCIAAYTARYDYVPEDKSLSRYFALLGANDPLCWWVGKADRLSYLLSDPDFKQRVAVQTFPDRLPSIGDNGFLFRGNWQDTMPLANHAKAPMDFWEAMRRRGQFTYYVVPHLSVWHRSGENPIDYLRRRYHYAKTLYFQKQDARLWHMVGPADYARCALFVLASLLILPHLFTVARGYAKVRDLAWLWHPVICLGLTLLYLWCWLTWGLLFPLLSRLLAVPKALRSAWNLFVGRPTQTTRLS